LSPWNIQDPHYNKCVWILGSTSQLNRVALGKALCKDPILQDLGIIVEVTWELLEVFPGEAYTPPGQLRTHAAHICCAANRREDCIDALIQVFAEDHCSDSYPLQTRLRCRINTSSPYYCTVYSLQRDEHLSATSRQLHQQQVSSIRRLLRSTSSLLRSNSLSLNTLETLHHYLQNQTAQDKTPLFLSILPSNTKGHLDLIYHRDHHSEAL